MIVNAPIPGQNPSIWEIRKNSREKGSGRGFKIREYIDNTLFEDNYSIGGMTSKKGMNEDVPELITKDPSTRIVVTTNTNAKYLAQLIQKEVNDKVIVVTEFEGDNMELDAMKQSDAFNLGYAFATIEHIKPGVYVSMSGKVFHPENVKKIIPHARFVSEH